MTKNHLESNNIYMTCEKCSTKPNPSAMNYSLKWFVGKFVKLGFDVPEFIKRNTNVQKEHLWVKVIGIPNGEVDCELIGLLWNNPMYINMSHGERLGFTRDDIEVVIDKDYQEIKL